jgi:hypothetical protein
MLDQRPGGLPPTAMDIVGQEIAGAFQDKLGVSMIHKGQSYQKPYDNRFDYHSYPMEQGYPNSQNFRVNKVRTRTSTYDSS